MLILRSLIFNLAFYVNLIVLMILGLPMMLFGRKGVLERWQHAIRLGSTDVRADFIRSGRRGFSSVMHPDSRREAWGSHRAYPNQEGRRSRSCQVESYLGA